MLRSIDSCQNRVPANQCDMLYRGLRCTTHLDECFFKFSSYVIQPIAGLEKLTSERHFLKFPRRASLFDLG